MDEKFQTYRSVNYPLPEKSWAWNLYGAGLENMGNHGAPEPFSIPEPNDDQLLARIDSVGVCFSDVKILKQGGSHPKLYNRNLAIDPTRLGHEVSLTIVKVGKNLQANYRVGQRLAVQPDIYQQGTSTAYGYTIPGGLIQYHLIGQDVLKTDAGACLLPLDDEMGYAESALLEPWGCVLAAYTQRRRLEPKSDGTMWIVGQQGDSTPFTFSTGLNAPATIVLTDVPPSVKQLAETTNAKIIERDGLTAADYETVSGELTNGAGFDDIVLLNPISADAISQAARVIARRGTCNLVGTRALDGLVSVDFGRLHYDYIAFLGANGTDIAAAYGAARNRCELRAGGTAVFIGAGGPMGQMHVQRALELREGPQVVIATEVSDERLRTLQEMFAPLAEKNERTLLFFNPTASQQSLHEFVMQAPQGAGADDVIACVPIAKLMEEGAGVIKADGMLVLFAGVPKGTMGAVNLSNVFLSNAQYTGTSGLTMDDQAAVMQRRLEGTLSPGRSVAAIGGLETAAEAIESVTTGRYAGKVVIFPQLRNLPLTRLDELHARLPNVAAQLGQDQIWTPEAERVLISELWECPQFDDLHPHAQPSDRP